MNIIKLSLILTLERIIRAASGFIVSIILTKNMGVAGYGEYSYLIALINIFNVFFTFGIDDYIVKEVALGKKIARKILWFRLLIQLLPLTITLIIYPYLNISFSLFPLIGLTLFYIWNLFYLLLITQNNNNNKIIAISLISIISIMFLAFKYYVSKYNILLFSILSVIECTLLSIILFKNVKSNFINIKISNNDIKFILKSSLPVGLASFAIILFYKIDQIIIEHYLGLKYLGIYALSSNILLAAGFLQSSFVTSCYSSIGAALKNSKNQLDNTLKKAYRGNFIIGVLIYSSYIIFGHYFLMYILPENYNEIDALLKISLISIIFSGYAAINSQYLFFINLQKIRLIRTLICLTFNIVTNIILLPKFGIYVAAFTFLLTQILMGTLLNLTLKETRKLFILQIAALLPWIKNEKNS